MTFYFNDQPITAQEDDTVAMALWREGIRLVFCGMGVCQECVVCVDGKRAESCMMKVRADMRVTGTPE